MPRYCKGCDLKNDLKVKKPTAYTEWKNAHIYVDTTTKVLREVWNLKVRNAYLSVQ